MREKISIHQIPADTKISRTTLWRAKKRGWLFLNYHSQELPSPNDQLFLENYEQVREVARHVAYIYFDRAPRWATIADLIQIGINEIWLKSGLPDFPARNWIWSVAKNRVRTFCNTPWSDPWTMGVDIEDKI